jgi:hypothetical protein
MAKELSASAKKRKVGEHDEGVMLRKSLLDTMSQSEQQHSPSEETLKKRRAKGMHAHEETHVSLARISEQRFLFSKEMFEMEKNERLERKKLEEDERERREEKDLKLIHLLDKIAEKLN